MNRLRWWKYGAAASIAAPAALVLAAHSNIASHLLFVAWVTAAAAVWIAAERKEQSGRLEQAVDDVRLASIRTLNHHRHDWMNELQVLYGYIRLQKPDKTVQCVERIRDRMIMESRIAKLGEPELVLFLQTFRTASKSLQLEVILEEEVDWTALGRDSGLHADRLTGLIEAYRHCSRAVQGDAPRLLLEMAQYDGVVEVMIQLTGELEDPPAMERQIREAVADSRFRIVTLAPEMNRIVLQAETGY
ncbi:Spo0B domain-containing protein [Paenibacillus sp. 1P07SE]|uniref:Spo0B domain-containing protein n=1 Tax=Paenibacillus sp. 1P07SE TaxID=3132209 RepID=UPI0039A6A22A